MASVSEIVDQIIELLSGRISLEQFEDWSASSSWSIHAERDAEGRDLAYRVRGILNEHADDPTEAALRQELAAVARQFPQSEPKAAEHEHSLFRFQPDLPSPYSIARSQYIPDEESNWQSPGAFVFGSLDASIKLSFGG